MHRRNVSELGGLSVYIQLIFSEFLPTFLDCTFSSVFNKFFKRLEQVLIGAKLISCPYRITVER